MMIDRPKTLPVTDLMVTPEGISWSVGNVLITFGVNGFTDACLTHDDLPEGATAKERLAEYTARILAAAVSAGLAIRHTTLMRSAILQTQALCATHGIDWENDPEALDKLEGVPHAEILRNVALLLS